jgi:lysyl-tRNA synthetase class I
MTSNSLMYISTVKQLASYFFFVEYFDDNLKVLSEKERIEYTDQAEKFIRCMQELPDEFDRTLGANWKDYEVYKNIEEEKIQECFYNVGKKNYGTEKAQLLQFFRHIYMVMFGKQTGPRIGTFVKIIGVEYFIDNLKFHMEHPYDFVVKGKILNV